MLLIRVKAMEEVLRGAGHWTDYPNTIRTCCYWHLLHIIYQYRASLLACLFMITQFEHPSSEICSRKHLIGWLIGLCLLLWRYFCNRFPTNIWKKFFLIFITMYYIIFSNIWKQKKILFLQLQLVWCTKTSFSGQLFYIKLKKYIYIRGDELHFCR